ncbi:hypothetical protein HOE37_05005 [Candidatus Woesearchaeota archaeon]|jgi:hypothetical protein|nr:hypothetical protein [Candidatus Woesearchaeota archaeon]MBT4111191.1 hypothetical protein [Candidatus Woesearchaeota archaeon]MBT4336771.1 hypothetical protein [Candidatus Woesearchaeota archaeon]MBT4469439.1 hypothetical protein [Candidatus Woesearchaeota archaeon]MBT6744166.1 hypothetical protein [Candidatus Woesearchaeota archaeon]
MGDLLQFARQEMANLYAIGLQIPVPTGAKFVDHGEVIDKKQQELWGSCTNQYSAGKMLTELMVNGLLERDVKTFARGHEEGHATFYLGHLKSLKEIAEELEVTLKFFTDDYCLKHDEAMKRFLIPGVGTNEDYNIAKCKPMYEREMIAHIGGLAALVNSPSAKKSIIEHVQHAICNGDINAYPLAKAVKITRRF